MKCVCLHWECDLALIALNAAFTLHPSIKKNTTKKTPVRPLIVRRDASLVKLQCSGFEQQAAESEPPPLLTRIQATAHTLAGVLWPCSHQPLTK